MRLRSGRGKLNLEKKLGRDGAVAEIAAEEEDAEAELLADTRRPDVVEASPSSRDGAVAAAGAFVAVTDVAVDGAPDSFRNEGADDDERRLLVAVGISATALGGPLAIRWGQRVSRIGASVCCRGEINANSRMCTP